MEDYLYSLLKAYKKLPQPIKSLFGAIYNLLPRNLRYGKFYSEYLIRVSTFNKYNNFKDIEIEQSRLLFSNLSEAIKFVPFYKKYPLCESFSQFAKLPIINKNVVVGSLSELTNPNYNSLKLKTNTGGSSGTPMVFYLEKNKSRAKEKAHFDWFWGQFGYSKDSKILMLRGVPLQNGRNFEVNMIDNILNVSCYNINEDNILPVLKEINLFKPEFIHGYPSSVKILTHLLEKYKNNLNISIKALFLGSEHLVHADRAFLEAFYNAKVVSWYGHTERLIHGGNCKYSHEYHFYPAYGYIELIDDQDKPVTQSGKEGRIIATGFDNKVMPFIRYDTGDLGVLSDKTECRCGFKGISLKEITGRGQDVILLTDNTKVSATAFIFGQHLDHFNKIREMQLQQEKAGELEMRIVKSVDFSNEEKKNMVELLEKSVDHKLKIDLVFVNDIEKTQRGKNIFFVSSLNKIRE